MENRLDVFQEGPINTGESCGAVIFSRGADRVLEAFRDAIPLVLVFFFILRVARWRQVFIPRKVVVVFAGHEAIEFRLDGVVQADESKNFEKHCKTKSKIL